MALLQRCITSLTDGFRLARIYVGRVLKGEKPAEVPRRMQMQGRCRMSNYYAAISALIFAVVAIGHLIRLLKRWTVQIGPFSVPMSVSWVGLIVTAVILP